MLDRATVLEHFQKLPERFSIDEAMEAIFVLYNLERSRLQPISSEDLVQRAEVAEADIAAGQVDDLALLIEDHIAMP